MYEDAFLRISEFRDFADMKIDEHKGRCSEIGEKKLGRNSGKHGQAILQKSDDEQKAKHVQKAHSYRESVQFRELFCQPEDEATQISRLCWLSIIPFLSIN